MTDDMQASSPDVPSWVHDAVFYQIFPDRFARSSHDEKPSCLLPWAAAPTSHGYHGGDLWGVVEHLDYLTDLGINAIYLNPIFQSASNHRYHTHDYEKVDPLLGGNAALRALVEAAHQRDIRIVLDGVFNHASRGFLPFHDILENGPDSPWLDWFRIGDWPLAPYDDSRPSNYDCWLGNRALPKFNTDHPQVREFLMRIGELWVRDYDIDGWRLDVPDEITTPGFWEEFRQRVRAIKPDAYLVGEIWEDAPDWLQGDRFDATMNYQWAAAVIAFTAGDRVSPILVSTRSYDPCPAIDAAEFAQRIDRLLNLNDWQVTKCQLNLLGSHDSPRLVSLARGDRASVCLATLLQMTFPGAPASTTATRFRCAAPTTTTNRIKTATPAGPSPGTIAPSGTRRCWRSFAKPSRCGTRIRCCGTAASIPFGRKATATPSQDPTATGRWSSRSTPGNSPSSWNCPPRSAQAREPP
jgi:cyclomaltodextrinase / maltogenic alpha-amylase / neopullulanase